MSYQPPPLDAAPPTPQQRQSAPNPFKDLVIGSENYWAGRTGREEPPAPTFRKVNGKLMLGRYMDPYGCQGHMPRPAEPLGEVVHRLLHQLCLHHPLR